ncbi:MAG: acyl-CoA synthetase [Gammaproteobacteria bacterium]|uniref:acyl-CoA synthetase n=1 Tax=Pseudomaricurvus alcaniphilus TaxID=1166482 RepID=UPI00140A82A2|nr:acyl-CoA synthetase [Pseudomaricurvus alcaniphilus]MBR9910835.1 acyl-CoA synthetase [Gammaproteobacteria bacterium]NHN37287.1 acyl-CoA synthetase [Pseudomaricurvus alcaniphilus]
MHPSIHARERPNAAAIIMAETGATTTYAELEQRSNQGAQLFRQLGLKPGDGIALWMRNCPEFLQICWAAQRSGLYFTPISTHLTLAEAAYIIKDSGARLLIAAAELAGVQELIASGAAAEFGPDFHCYFDTDEASLPRWSEAVAAQPSARINDETAGQYMVYSSGTTGKPKGVQLPLSGAPADQPLPFVAMQREQYGVSENSIYLSPAPLYHAAPLVFSMTMQSIGGCVVICEKFEPEALLGAIERFKVTHIQMVPTMFVRLLKLPEERRRDVDCSSLECVIHAAAPCPVPIKQQMIDWWGPILCEYYGGSEGNGATYITSAEWLRKPGSVGRAQWGILHICDEEGEPLPAGEQGVVYFEGGFDFKYKNDDAKTRDARNPKHPGWSTLGDIGYLDEDGYLFLTDRKSFMIISGGVNIYPQEIENVLAVHPKVMDVAVFGVPNPEFGEEVKAVVQPLHWADAGDELAAELMAYCRTQLSAVKCPRSIDFDAALPRMDNGKLYKKPLRDRYWPAKG